METTSKREYRILEDRVAGQAVYAVQFTTGSGPQYPVGPFRSLESATAWAEAHGGIR